jgi:hypothetical protein
MRLHHNKHMSHRSQKGASVGVCVCVSLSLSLSLCPSAKLQTIDFCKVKSLARMHACMYV